MVFETVTLKEYESYPFLINVETGKNNIKEKGKRYKVDVLLIWETNVLLFMFMM